VAELAALTPAPVLFDRVNVLTFEKGQPKNKLSRQPELEAGPVGRHRPRHPLRRSADAACTPAPSTSRCPPRPWSTSRRAMRSRRRPRWRSAPTTCSTSIRKRLAAGAQHDRRGAVLELLAVRPFGTLRVCARVLQGWEADLAVLKSQVAGYDAWVKSRILPRARKEVRLPEALYVNRLANVGVDIAPDQLIERAGFDFQEVRDQMQVVANGIAIDRKMLTTDYRDVLRELKKTSIPEDQLMPYYRERLRDIEGMIRAHDLVTLPSRDANIRVATAAEAARSPAPFMSPPRLIGNTGEYGEFVIPLANPNAKSKAKMDDFDFTAMSWTLAAHEARPGHELQFASMVEQGMSVARATFAFNSTNVEGWGLYSEALVLPYMPSEGQLVSLQARLLRMARALLDPQINLGRMTPEQAKAFLMKEVVLSEPFAQSEVDRYSYRSPGQATAYYYGYVKLRALKTLAELELGKDFKLKAFNDFVIAQGILPPALLKQAVLEDFIPAQKALSQTK
jgi:uncharacterized protein (DUF885 family)